MYTSVVGKKFVSYYNAKKGTTYSAEEYFEDKLWAQFFDHERYLINPVNSPVFQINNHKKSGIPEARQKSLLEIKSKISGLKVSDEKLPDMTFAIGYGAANSDGTTSGQITTMELPLEEEDLYASWIGAACGIGIAGAVNILTDHEEILALIAEGWPLYREYVNANEGLENKVETWNGVWLAHRLSKDYDPKRPKANFTPFSVSKKGEVKMERPEWSKLAFLFSRMFPTLTLNVYIYSLGQMNKTIGFFTMILPEVKRLADMYQHLYGKVTGLSNKELAAVYETAFTLGWACERFSVLGLRALEPKDLRKYMASNSGKEPAPLKWNAKTELTFFLYITWIVAMLNKEELNNLAQDAAQMLSDYCAGGKKGTMLRSNVVDDLVNNTKNQNDFIKKVTDIMRQEKELTPVIEKLVRAVMFDIQPGNLTLFITLIRFYYLKKN